MRNENIEALHVIYNTLCPSKVEQDALYKMRLEMEQDNRDDADIILAIVAALHDGLAHGNWIKESK